MSECTYHNKLCGVETKSLDYMYSSVGDSFSLHLTHLHTEYKPSLHNASYLSLSLHETETCNTIIIIMESIYIALFHMFVLKAEWA